MYQTINGSLILFVLSLISRWFYLVLKSTQTTLNDSALYQVS